MSKSITSEKIELKNVRLSFIDLWQAKAFQEGQTKSYSATFLLDPSDKQHQKFIKLIKSEAKRIIAEKGGSYTVKKDNLCFGMGDDLDKVYDGYEGMFYIKAKKPEADGRPTIVDADMNPLTSEDAKPYSGCYVDTTFTLWTQDNQFGKRVNGNLRAIRFRSDGDAFGRPAIDADDEFSEVAEADGDFLDD